MKTARQTNLFFFPGVVLCFGHFFDNTIHTHHSIQITVGSEDEFVLRYDDAEHRHRTAIIAPDIPHKLYTPGGPVMLMLFDNETGIAKRLMVSYLRDHNVNTLDTVLRRKERARFMSRQDIDSCAEGKQIVDDMVGIVLGYPRPETNEGDERIQKAIDMIQRLPVVKISTAEIADHACLSESRLQHLFKEQVGIPIRRYLLWRRLHEAIKKIVENMSLTDAAHDVGFYDSAHLSNTFRSTYGLSLSQIFKNRESIRLISCME